MISDPALSLWIRQRRTALGLTQAELANRLGCSLSLLRKIERGERGLVPDLQARLIALLGSAEATPPSVAAKAVPTSAPQWRPGAVPAPPNRLIGRDAALVAIQRQLIEQGVRLLCLTGPPGIGKTRLAQHAAMALHTTLDRSVIYLALADLRHTDEVLTALAGALGLQLRPRLAPIEQISVTLYAQPFLLVLDNCEHLPALAPMLADLLAACPHLQILATSRTPLRLRAEQTFPVPPLSLPADPYHPEAARAAAVRLFVDRVRAYDPHFMLDAERLATVAAICLRLDGIPLALELAAARLDAFDLSTLLTQLAYALPVLTAGPRDLPTRQRTLREAIAWSYDLLDPADQVLFIQLAVFVGGCSRDSALAVCDAALEEQGFERLQAASLIQFQAERISLLATLREFAAEQLQAAGMAPAMQRRHAAHYVDLAEQAEALLNGAEAPIWFDRLAIELPNLRAAMHWSLTSGDGGLAATRIAVALHSFWRVRGHFDELRPLEAPLLADSLAIPLGLRAKALYTLGFLVSQQSDPRCFPLIDAAVQLAESCGDQRLAVRCLNLQGLLARLPGSYARALALHQRAVSYARRLSDPDLLGSTLNNLGMALACLARYAEASACYREALDLAQRHSQAARFAERLPNLAETLLLLGDRVGAAARYREALKVAESMNHREVLAEVYDGLGRLALLDGDLPLAAQQLHTSLTIYRELGLGFAIVRVQRNLGYLALQQGDRAAAAAYFRVTLLATPLPNLGDMAVHCLLGLARLAQLHNDLDRAARLAGCAQQLRLAYQLRPEPEEAALRRLLEPLAVSHPQAWSAGAAADPTGLIAEVLTDHPEG